MVDSASTVTLRQLVIRQSDDDPDTYVVGRLEGGEFVELPQIGVEAIRLLQAGLTVEEAEDRLADGADRPDIAGLVQDLLDLAWVATLDGRPLADPVGTTGHLGWLRPRHVRWLFTRYVAGCYAALLAVAAVTVVRQPDLLPSYLDFFWTDYVGVATLVNTLLFVASGMVHELMHLAAARSLDLPARIGLGTRLVNLALQTDVSAAWTLPRRQRYRIYLAGMAWDSAAVSAALLACAYTNPSDPVRGLLASYILITTVGLVFQAQVWMRTDLYFALADLLRCGNLFHDGLGYARYLAQRTVRVLRHRPGPANPAQDLPPSERRAVRIYAPLVIAGSVAALAVYAMFGVPILVTTSVRAIHALAEVGSGGRILPAIDGAMVLAVQWGLQLLFVVTFYRSHPAWFRRGRHRANPKGGESHA